MITYRLYTYNKESRRMLYLPCTSDIDDLYILRFKEIKI